MVDKRHDLKTAEQMAELLSVSPRTLRRRVKAGLYPKPENGFFLADLVLWIEEGREDMKAAIDVQKLRRAKRLNDLAEGLLLDAELVNATVAEMCAAIAMGLEAVPGRLAAQISGLHGQPAKIEALLRSEYERILESGRAKVTELLPTVAKGLGYAR